MFYLQLVSTFSFNYICFRSFICHSRWPECRFVLLEEQIALSNPLVRIDDNKPNSNTPRPECLRKCSKASIALCVHPMDQNSTVICFKNYYILLLNCFQRKCVDFSNTCKWFIDLLLLFCFHWIVQIILNCGTKQSRVSHWEITVQVIKKGVRHIFFLPH